MATRRRRRNVAGPVAAFLVTLAVLFNLAIASLIVWGLIEFIKFLARH